MAIANISNLEELWVPDWTFFQVSCRTVAPDHVIGWHAHQHDELCLILQGTPSVGYAAGKISADDLTKTAADVKKASWTGLKEAKVDLIPRFASIV